MTTGETIKMRRGTTSTGGTPAGRAANSLWAKSSSSRSHTTTRRRLVVTALLTGFAMVVGIAFAAWLADGTGLGSARARVAEALTTLDVAASATADLYPGGHG